MDSIHEREVNALSTALMNKSGELTELQEHLFNSVDGIMEMFMV